MSKVLAHEEIIVDGGVQQLSPSVYSPPDGASAVYAVIHAEGGDMRYFVDGNDPSPSSGALLENGDIVELPSIYHIANFKVVKAAVDPGKLVVTYEV